MFRAAISGSVERARGVKSCNVSIRSSGWVVVVVDVEYGRFNSLSRSMAYVTSPVSSSVSWLKRYIHKWALDGDGSGGEEDEDGHDPDEAMTRLARRAVLHVDCDDCADFSAEVSVVGNQSHILVADYRGG